MTLARDDLTLVTELLTAPEPGKTPTLYKIGMETLRREYHRGGLESVRRCLDGG